jgi:hypothetical protein
MKNQRVMFSIMVAVMALLVTGARAASYSPTLRMQTNAATVRAMTALQVSSSVKSDHQEKMKAQCD